MTATIQTLSSENSMLRSELQKKSEIEIRLQNEEEHTSTLTSDIKKFKQSLADKDKYISGNISTMVELNNKLISEEKDNNYHIFLMRLFATISVLLFVVSIAIICKFLIL